MRTLWCDAVRKSFDGVRVLDDIGLQFSSRNISAIIGPNGAGKTTLFNILTGFLRPDGGRCFLGDREITDYPPYRIAGLGVARTFQDLRLITLVSVLDNVLLARPKQCGESLGRALLRIGVAADEARNREKASLLLRSVGLKEEALELAGDLSYGQQKLLTLAVCLATEARVLLLDEPVAGVHPEMAEKILWLLRQLRHQGKQVVFIEHDIRVVREVADHVIVMDEGRVVAEGPPSEVLERPDILEAYVA